MVLLWGIEIVEIAQEERTEDAVPPHIAHVLVLLERHGARGLPERTVGVGGCGSLVSCGAGGCELGRELARSCSA